VGGIVVVGISGVLLWAVDTRFTDVAVGGTRCGGGKERIPDDKLA
jgi:hypothetical protein